jgi:peptidoglycan-associated lipoprotein
MKNFKAILIVTAVALTAAACSKRVATAPPPPNKPPVAANTAAPAKAPPLAAAKPAPTKETAPAPAQTKATPAAKLAPQQRTAINELLARLEDALFDYDQATIRPDASAALRDNVVVVRNILADYPTEKLLIEGHADERGSSEYNLALGNRRARAAQEFLASMGIPATQLSVISLGEERPVCTDQQENCWQRNRRAHITVAP